MKNFYKNKKILITGHTGFKGSWLCLWLKHMGSDVLGISNKNYQNSDHFNQLKLNIKTKYIDIRDKKKIHKIINLFKPDIIFHLAAQSLVKKGHQNPFLTFDTNVNGTLNVLDSVKDFSKKIIIINVTTDKCYKNNISKKAFREDDKLGGDDPYSSSKVLSELLTTSYQEIYKNKKIYIASARCGNVIGGGDWSEDRIIPDLVNSITKNKTLKVRGFKNVRPWLHVLDSLRGYLILAKTIYAKPKLLGAYNFSPEEINKTVSVGKIIDIFSQKWKKVKIKKVDKAFFEHNYLKLNSLKAKEKFGWKPLYSTNEAIHSTIEWYKENENEKKNISKIQLIKYLNL